MYMRAGEWSGQYGGKQKSLTGGGVTARTLPFNCCALTLNPFTAPMCNRTGVMFDVMAILPFLKENGIDPTTGEKCSRRDLITLNMSKNEDGDWHCPVLCKPFSNHTKVVAVYHKEDNTANVFSYEAVQELNIKAKNWEDLLDGRPFKKKDIIVLQDVEDQEHMKARDINHFKVNFKTSSKLASAGEESGASRDINQSVTGARIMDEVNKRKREEEESRKAKEVERRKEMEATAAQNNIDLRDKMVDIYTDELQDGVKLTSGASAASMTSTAEVLSSDSKARLATDEEIMKAKGRALRKYKKKGFVTINTNFGAMTFEIDCDIVPKTANNFIGLIEKKYYDGTVFHRSIGGFMLQGGDPLGTGRGGESLWGGKFEDEFDTRISHDGRGILSMANAGSNTNRSQFFITYGECKHLDMKHAVFGRMIGGGEVLDLIESVKTDKNDRPKQEVKIFNCLIIENPIAEVEKIEMAKIRKAREEKAEAERAARVGDGAKKRKAEGSAEAEFKVGMFLEKNAPVNVKDEEANNNGGDDIDDFAVPRPKKKKPKAGASGGFGNFSGW